VRFYPHLTHTLTPALSLRERGKSQLALDLSAVHRGEGKGNPRSICSLSLRERVRVRGYY